MIMIAGPGLPSGGRKCGLRLINIKDSLTANFFADFSALDIEKLQENGRGIFAVPKVAEFIVILICKVYPMWCFKRNGCLGVLLSDMRLKEE